MEKKLCEVPLASFFHHCMYRAFRSMGQLNELSTRRFFFLLSAIRARTTSSSLGFEELLSFVRLFARVWDLAAFSRKWDTQTGCAACCPTSVLCVCRRRDIGVPGAWPGWWPFEGGCIKPNVSSACELILLALLMVLMSPNGKMRRKKGTPQNQG